MGLKLPQSTYAVLGLIDKKPGSGYALAALADQSLGYFWPISRTLLYRELARLESLGWAVAIDVAQDRFPDKRVWSTTEEGRSALIAWLSRPAESPDGFRSGVLLKLLFGARMPAEALTVLLAEYRESLQATATQLAAIVERLQGGAPSAAMGRLAALHGLRTAEARLGWLDEIEAELKLSSAAAAVANRGPVSGSDGESR